MIYYEYNEELVEAGKVPAKLCCSHSFPLFPLYPTDNPDHMAMAERAFYIKNGFAHDIKNRYGAKEICRVFSVDELALKLRAVLI